MGREFGTPTEKYQGYKTEYYFICRNDGSRCWNFVVQHTQKCIEVFENETGRFVLKMVVFR